MNKTATALACTGMLLAPALAQAQSNVTIYGRLNLDFESVRASSGTAAASLPARNRVSSNSSNIGFRGSEDLGNGLQAWFQIESQINADSGTATSTTGVLAGRNSGVGLKGNWGNVFLGRWDSPYKVAQVKFDPFGDVTIASQQNILGQASSTPAGDFHERTSNGVQYWSPDIAGFSGRIAYGANENKSDVTGVDNHTWSGALLYEQGPVFAVAAYERHDDRGTLGGANTTGSDTGKQAGFGFKFGESKVGLIFERLEYETDAAGGSDLRRDAWFLGASHQIGPWELRGYYAHAGDQKGSNAAAGPDTGAKAYSIGLAYDLSKRTELYTSYTRIDNERNAEYEFGINASPGLGNKGRPGSDPSGFLVGIKHVF